MADLKGLSCKVVYEWDKLKLLGYQQIENGKVLQMKNCSDPKCVSTMAITLVPQQPEPEGKKHGKS